MTDKVRRTQAERRQGTRKQLLDAAIECLVERGYSGTTTTEIADRAGVSRGAQLHHFPTKAELLAAALDHLFQRRHEEYLSAIARLPPGADRLTASIEQIWGVLSGPTFYAWLELIVAARTDPTLRRTISGVADRFAATVDVSFKNQFPDAIGTPFFEVAPGFTFALLQGLALENILEGTLPHNRIGRVLDAFRDISRLVLPDVAGAARPKSRRRRA